MPLNVLMVGAGVCGPAFAMLLQRSNPKHKITIVERFPTMRVTGQQVDLKTQAPVILRKMGLIKDIKSRCVNETGFEVVNSIGKQIGVFPASAAGERRLGLTSEYEIMRGDLVEVLYNASLKQDSELKQESVDTRGLTYLFGLTVTSLSQTQKGTDVTFSDGTTKNFDLVVAADGQGSKTRSLAFGSEASKNAFKSLGVHGAYFSVPRIEGEETLAKGHLVSGKRMIITRTSGRSETGVLLYTMAESLKLKSCYAQSVDIQKKAFAEIFKDVDWQADRLIKGIYNADAFYAHELCQIKMKQLYTGKVVLLGDAGYCPSPFTGLGTNLCLLGSYILAGELARHNHNLDEALKNYDAKMKPFIEECQQISSSLNILFPSSHLGVWLTEKLIWVFSKLNKFHPVFLSSKDNIDHIPSYPELNLADVALSKCLSINCELVRL